MSRLTQKQIDASCTRATSYERQKSEKLKNGICARHPDPSSLCPLVESFPSAAVAAAVGNGRRRLPQQPAAESAATSHGVNALMSGPGSKMHTRATNLPPA